MESNIRRVRLDISQRQVTVSTLGPGIVELESWAQCQESFCPVIRSQCLEPFTEDSNSNSMSMSMSISTIISMIMMLSTDTYLYVV